MGFFESVKRGVSTVFPFHAAVNNPSSYKKVWSGITGQGAPLPNDRELQMQMRQEDIALQREFAQNGIRWRVDDAKAAGLHPLAALGASSASYSPVTTLLDPLPSERPWQEQMGQNIRSNLMSRLDPISLMLSMKSVERAGLENDLLRLQLQNAQTNAPSASDPYLTGQTNSGKGDPLVVDEPLRRIVADPNDPSKEAGAIQDYQIVQTGNGYSVVPGRNVKQAIEDSPMEYQWLARAATRSYRHPITGQKMYMNPLTGRLFNIRRNKKARNSIGYEKFLP